jgi:hypothetical protein
VYLEIQTGAIHREAKKCGRKPRSALPQEQPVSGPLQIEGRRLTASAVSSGPKARGHLSSKRKQPHQSASAVSSVPKKRGRKHLLNPPQGSATSSACCEPTATSVLTSAASATSAPASASASRLISEVQYFWSSVRA